MQSTNTGIRRAVGRSGGRMADLGSGQYVDKGKYDAAVAEKENLEGQIKTLNTTIGDLKKNNADNEREYPKVCVNL